MTVAARTARGKKAHARKPERRDTTRSNHLQNSLGDAAALLRWYDCHRRVLPWRALPGEKPDPYRVWLSEIMLQQTTVKAVAPYFGRFEARWPNVCALAQAPVDDVLKMWAGLGYYARARNLHACAKAVLVRHGGHFPESEAELGALPGIGPYSAAAIASIAFGKRAAAIDGNGERVLARFFAVETKLPAARPQIRRLAESLLPSRRAGDFAQALMDLGAAICTPKKPACMHCPWMQDCRAHRRGDQETFPRKAPRQRGHLRRGAAFLLRRADHAILVRRRAMDGLLGGMVEVPTSEWTRDFDARNALVYAPRLRRGKPKWHRLPGFVEHTFTHFPLQLIVYTATVGTLTPAPAGTRWVAVGELAGEALPSIMRKVLAHALRSSPIANGAAAALIDVRQRLGGRIER
jgi:A/G-specific adenine glycosylase